MNPLVGVEIYEILDIVVQIQVVGGKPQESNQGTRDGTKVL